MISTYFQSHSLNIPIVTETVLFFYHANSGDYQGNAEMHSFFEKDIDNAHVCAYNKNTNTHLCALIQKSKY